MLSTLNASLAAAESLDSAASERRRDDSDEGAAVEDEESSADDTLGLTGASVKSADWLKRVGRTVGAAVHQQLHRGTASATPTPSVSIEETKRSEAAARAAPRIPGLSEWVRGRIALAGLPPGFDTGAVSDELKDLLPSNEANGEVPEHEARSPSAGQAAATATTSRR
jgi:hypothetical protein